MASSNAALEIAGVSAPEPAHLSLFYASQTGNGESLARLVSGQAVTAGLTASAASLQDLRPARLKKLKHAVFIISTHGEGDPPDDALDLFEYLQADTHPDLSGLSFAILALGDRSYELFCEAGRQLDHWLRHCGALPFQPMVECDVDFDDAAEQWAETVLEFGREHFEAAAAGAASSTTTQPPAEASIWTRQRPFPARVRDVRRITGRQSIKQVCHVELDLEGSGINYVAGDSLGVWPVNDSGQVQDLLAQLGLNGSVLVHHDQQQRSLRDWLGHHLEITRVSADLVAAWAEAGQTSELTNLWQSLDKEQRRDFIECRQLIDLAEAFPARFEAAELVALLRPLAPRSYSVASDAETAEGGIDLTVATLNSTANDSQRTGVTSGLLNQRLQTEDEVRVYLEPNRRFRLPENRSTPLILIGAGTGIAPFRAFLQQLEEEGEKPPVWLIFGNPNQRTDFLYQRDWLRWRAQGLVSRIDAAWSRDQQQKIYVQHKVEQQAEQILEWLERGACLYLCGALSMGHAVEEALLAAHRRIRGESADGAGRFLSSLRKAGQLKKDLY